MYGLTHYVWHQDGVIKWKHFPCYCPFVRGIHWWPVNSPHKGQWRGALMFSLICVWINGWINKREASDLRRKPAHYDVTVMITHWPWQMLKILKISLNDIFASLSGAFSVELQCDTNDLEITYTHVMVWCRQATGLCLSQLWPSSISSYGVASSWRVNPVPIWNFTLPYDVKHISIFITMTS